MSALGQKQTFKDYLPNVRFRGQSGPKSTALRMSANSQKRTSVTLRKVCDILTLVPDFF